MGLQRVEQDARLSATGHLNSVASGPARKGVWDLDVLCVLPPDVRPRLPQGRPGAKTRPQSETREAGVSAPSIDHHEQRLPFPDDVRGQQRRAAAADIPHRPGNGELRWTLRR